VVFAACVVLLFLLTVVWLLRAIRMG
jgi:hypothetical protein